MKFCEGFDDPSQPQYTAMDGPRLVTVHQEVPDENAPLGFGPHCDIQCGYEIVVIGDSDELMQRDVVFRCVNHGVLESWSEPKYEGEIDAEHA
jgi:hypothetical protein